MKTFLILTIFFHCAIFSFVAQNDSIPNIDINYSAGDMAVRTWRISLHNTDSGLVAVRTEPQNPMDFTSDTLAIAPVNDSQIKTIKKFIEKARELQHDSCPSPSSIMSGYTIRVLPLYLIYIDGDCNINGMDFRYLDHLIFPNY